MVEKAVRLTPSSDAPAASGPDRATSSGVDVNFRDLTARVDRLQGETARHAKWATRAIDELKDEHRTFADQMLESRGGRGYHVVDRPRDPDTRQDWREAIEEINRKVQDLTRRVYRQGRDHDATAEKAETANARIAALDENAQGLQQAVQAIRTQLGNLPSGTEQTQAVFRRELVFYRNMLDDAFAGQGHRIRSPTPTPGDRNASDQPQVNRGSSLPSAPRGWKRPVGLELVLMQADRSYSPPRRMR